MGGARLPREPAGSSVQRLSRHEVNHWPTPRKSAAAARRRGRAGSCSGGLRVGELCAANIDDLGESTWHHTLTLRAESTKGGKAALIALAPRTVQAVGLATQNRRSGALLGNQFGPPRHRRDRAVPRRRQLNRCPCPGRWAARMRPCLPGERSGSWLGDVAPRDHVR